MAEHTVQPAWRVMGTSVRGAAHVRTGKPNQDAIGWWPPSGTGLPLLLAVADGHGSARSFRSHLGAQLAVNTATRVLQDFLQGQPALTTLSASKRLATEQLPQALVRRWQEAVTEALREAPLAPDELAALPAEDSAAVWQAVETNPLLAYGTTLLTALVTASFLLYLQLGDGDILTVSDTGQVTRPVASDERLFANETTSLCVPHAWRDMRVGFQALAAPAPALILLATDGYANSFRTDEGFLQVGADLLAMLRADGLDRVQASLETWLTEASQTGSGDDITLGLLCRLEAVHTPAGCTSDGAGQEPTTRPSAPPTAEPPQAPREGGAL